LFEDVKTLGKNVRDLDENVKNKLGWSKIENCCRIAETNGFDYVWIDICCIDKSSSAELTEAINSMYRWYKKATMCFVYLDDVMTGSDIDAENSPFAKARWFQR
jgi:hypothetical protein